MTSRACVRSRLLVIAGTSYYIRQHVLGLVAIFIALSGTAWAAAKIGAGDIKDDAVHSPTSRMAR